MSSKVAVVTGGNKGIGKAIVQALCKDFQGDVYLTARDEYVLSHAEHVTSSTPKKRLIKNENLLFFFFGPIGGVVRRP